MNEGISPIQTRLAELRSEQYRSRWLQLYAERLGESVIDAVLAREIDRLSVDGVFYNADTKDSLLIGKFHQLIAEKERQQGREQKTLTLDPRPQLEVKTGTFHEISFFCSVFLRELTQNSLLLGMVVCGLSAECYCYTVTVINLAQIRSLLNPATVGASLVVSAAVARAIQRARYETRDRFGDGVRSHRQK